MAKKETLPAEVHEYFRKANILHGYVTTELGEASQHALETGQELLAAKSSCPHGSWEDECKRLFEGSLRTAQCYMQLAKYMGALPKAQRSALLFLEGSIDGAAKAAKNAAKPNPPKPKPKEPEPDEVIDVDSRPVEEEPEEDSPPEEPIQSPEKPDKAAYFAQWTKDYLSIVSLVDAIAAGMDAKDGDSHQVIQGQLEACDDEMRELLEVE